MRCGTIRHPSLLARMHTGREVLTQYKPFFDAVEKGLRRRPLRPSLRFWGVEHPLFDDGRRPQRVRSTATLACIVPAARLMSKDEFLSALEILIARRP